MKLVCSGVLEGLSTRGDHTIKVVIGTDEMGVDDAGRLFYFRGKYIKFLLSDDEITKLQEEIVSAQPITEAKGKTPSQRLRNTLFRVFEHTKPKLEFDAFYKSEMERIIAHYQEKLRTA